MNNVKPRRCRHMISISPKLDDILLRIARHEEVSVQQVIVKVLEEHMQSWAPIHPATMAEALDPARIQTRYYDFGAGPIAEIK